MGEGIGGYLQELRTGQGLTTTQLAQKAGLRRATLSEWQAGKRQPRLPELESVLTALNASNAQKRVAWESLRTPACVLRLREETVAANQELVEVAGMAPHGGDLLRAMRMRKGWTQATLAEKMNVSQVTVVRWERAERWPDTGLLHTLCYLLGAREEELTALTVGRFSLAEGQPPLDEEALWTQRLHGFLTRFSPSEYALADLRLLSLMAHAWSLAARRSSGRRMFAEMMTEYSGYLFRRHQFEEARRMAVRALDIYSTMGWKDTWTDTAVARLAEASAYSGSEQGLDSATALLRQWLPESTEAVYTGWLLGDLAKFKAARGENAAAIALGREAVQRTAYTPNVEDYFHRRHDLARILVKAGRAQEAQELLADHLPHPFYTLVRAEVSQALGEQATAFYLLQKVEEAMEEAVQISQPEIAFYRPIVENLAEQWQGTGNK